MRITGIDIIAEGSSNVCALSFRDPRRQNPYNVKGITGLDASDIVPRYYGASNFGTDKFHNLSLDQREIVVLIELNPHFSGEQTYSSLRDQLYKMIASSRTGIIQLLFNNETETIAGISGFVTKFESNLFSKSPEVQLTIKCDYPMLRSPSIIYVDVELIDPTLIIISDYLSTAPHGFDFTVQFTDAIDRFYIGDPGGKWSFELNPVGGFLMNDLLFVTSEYNDKRVILSRGDDVYIPITDAIKPNSRWPIIFPDDNAFECATPSILSFILISYYPAYWGI